jgi:glutamine synthetase
MGVNGNGMHANLSISGADGTNLFYDAAGRDGVSAIAWGFIERTLSSAQESCLILNSSVNAYRRLDPHFEAPNQIKVSAINRGAMVRIPLGNQKSARVEVRSIAPDANPYLLSYALLRTGLEGPRSEEGDEQQPFSTRLLPDNVYDAIRLFKGSEWMLELMGETVHHRYHELKHASAERCPAALGTQVKVAEIQFHHEVTNQFLWSIF